MKAALVVRAANSVRAGSGFDTGSSFLYLLDTDAAQTNCDAFLSLPRLVHCRQICLGPAPACPKRGHSTHRRFSLIEGTASCMGYQIPLCAGSSRNFRTGAEVAIQRLGEVASICFSAMRARVACSVPTCSASTCTKRGTQTGDIACGGEGRDGDDGLLSGRECFGDGLCLSHFRTSLSGWSGLAKFSGQA
jgi:hypothetical protein